VVNYYNEFDDKAAQWLRNLVDAGLIPQGYVDSRSITEVEPDELKRYTQCHFFAGIAGWPLALQLAGWPTDRPVWTGSCPCQPFSTAGKQKGKADHRHLWPVFFKLIATCKPDTLFMEQVASAIGHGWLDEVINDLEGVYFGNNRENLHRMQNPEIFDRVSEILWKVKRGSSPSLQDLPTGIREEVAQFIQRIQGEPTSKTQGIRQIISPELQHGEQSTLFNFLDKISLPAEGDTFRLGSLRDENKPKDRKGILRSQRIPPSDDIRETELQQPINRSDRPESGVCISEYQDCGIRGECGNGELGGRCLQGNNEILDGQINEDKHDTTTTFGRETEITFTHGWLDDVYQGLESEGYACGAAVLPACSVGAPHRRDRLFFVANLSSAGLQDGGKQSVFRSAPEQEFKRCCGNGSLVNTEHNGSSTGQVSGINGQNVSDNEEEQNGTIQSEGTSESGHVADTSDTGLQGHTRDGEDSNQSGRICSEQSRSAWESGVWIGCPDGKQRLVESSVCLILNGISGNVAISRTNKQGKIETHHYSRVIALKAIGNAIVPQVAAEFIKAYMEVENEYI